MTNMELKNNVSKEFMCNFFKVCNKENVKYSGVTVFTTDDIKEKGIDAVMDEAFKIAKKSKRISSALMAFGVFTYITIHIVVNLGGVTGLLPLNHGKIYILVLFKLFLIFLLHSRMI